MKILEMLWWVWVGVVAIHFTSINPLWFVDWYREWFSNVFLLNLTSTVIYVATSAATLVAAMIIAAKRTPDIL